MKKIISLVVIYHKFIELNKTIESLVEFSSSKNTLINQIIIWDNSTDTSYINKNKTFSRQNNFIYLSTGENKSLSTVYNQVIKESTFDYIIISDDDTIYTAEYFNELELFFNYNSLVAVPLIYNNGVLVSPAKQGFVVGKYLKKPKVGLQENLIAITSGMVLSSKVKEVSSNIFDEKLTFYGIDTDFFYRLIKSKTPIYVLNTSIKHSLSMFSPSQNNKESEEKKEFRYTNSKNATIYINFKRSFFHGYLSKLYFKLYELIYRS